MAEITSSSSISQYDYDLPPDLIAQHPSERRDASRLLVVRRHGSVLGHHLFHDLPELLRPGDLLVLNDTRVLPARLLGRRERTGGRWEGLFLHEHPGPVWELLAQTRGRPVEGEILLADPPAPDGQPLRLRLAGRTPEGRWLLEPQEPGTVVDLLTAHGHIPLPPYIRKGRASAEDRERYQTVYASQPGAVAAPTAGLHFTADALDHLRTRGIERAFLTLHVGAGTFQPIQCEDVREHPMHAEWCSLPEETVRAIDACRQRGGRVVAVGTTSVRVLESAALAAEDAGAAAGTLQPWSGLTNLFIYPPYSFRVIDALITNFHLPRSSLLVLVAAFAGLSTMHQAYRVAVEQAYRFYSYGDAMLLLPGESDE